MIHVSERELEIIIDIIKAHAPTHDVLVFGSRFNSVPKKYSDLDLAFIGDERLSLQTRTLLEDAFSESDLPFRVDVVDYRAASPDFRAIIDARSGAIYRGNGKFGAGIDDSASIVV